MAHSLILFPRPTGRLIRIATMAQLTLNSEIMTFGYSGISVSHRRDDDQTDAAAGSAAQDEPSAPETVFRPVRSLLVQRLNRRG